MGRKFLIFLLFIFMPMYVWAEDATTPCADFTNETECIGTESEPVLGCQWLPDGPPGNQCVHCVSGFYGRNCNKECLIEAGDGYTESHQFGEIEDNATLRGARTKYECYKGVTNCIDGLNEEHSDYTYNTDDCRAYYREFEGEEKDPYIICNNFTPGTDADGAVELWAEQGVYHFDNVGSCAYANNSTTCRNTCVKNEINCYEILPLRISLGNSAWWTLENTGSATYLTNEHKWDVSSCAYNSAGQATYSQRANIQCYLQIRTNAELYQNAGNSFSGVTQGALYTFENMLSNGTYNCIGCKEGYKPHMENGRFDKCEYVTQGYYSVGCTDAYSSNSGSYFVPDGCSNDLSNCVRCTVNDVVYKNAQKACPSGMTTDTSGATDIAYCHYTPNNTFFCDTSGCYGINDLRGWTFYGGPRGTFTCLNYNCTATD